MTTAQQLHPEQITEWIRGAVSTTAQKNVHLTADSRRINVGDVFIAYPGDAGDGRNYIAQAIQAGASAVIYEAADEHAACNNISVPHLAVHELKQQAGSIAKFWYGQPDQSLFSVAVTGTNGKTSCTQWIAQALSRDAVPTAVIGTLGSGLFKQGEVNHFEQTGYTTPDAVQLQRQLATNKQAGAKACAIEASSIGLDQGRLNALHIDVAVLTNFTRDHLDYHGSMAAYEAAKTRLFDWPTLTHVVINLDDAMGSRLLEHVRKKFPALTIFAYSIEGAASSENILMLSAKEIRITQNGMSFQLITPFGQAQIRSRVIGRFNVSNMLAVAGVLFARGLTLQKITTLLESLLAIPGRMQQLGGVEAPLAVIDYAHTPDALEKTLHTLREVAVEREGALWCVFGCGGDRDPGKRPQMGAVACAADQLVITSDNPRSEDPTHIIQQIVSGIPESMQQKPEVIPDRASAILYAIRHAAKNDVVLIAGKGHENYQEIKGRRLAFLDADHAALALATCATRHGGH